MSVFCGAVVTRSNRTLGRVALAAVVGLTLTLATGCSGGGEKHSVSTSVTGSQAGLGSTPQSAAAFAWTAQTATRRIGGATISVAGQRQRVDPAAAVCWGIGSPARRRPARLWRRFDCVAPTFHGGRAGPDILLALEPTGPTSFRILNARFSSYGGG